MSDYEVSNHLREQMEANEAYALSAGRHPKWVRAQPGTVIPAGQPYRVEYERTAPEPFTVMDEDPVSWFIDATWSPPLELPTPTCPLCDGQHKMTACPDYPAYQRWVKNREANQ